MPATSTLSAFISRWSESQGAERANKDLFLAELCDVLGVPRPSPSTGDPAKDLYTFERDARIVHAGGTATLGKIDLYKDGCFVLEAKQGSDKGSKKLGTARRGTPGWNIAMSDALGQALQYVQTMEKRPPFLVTCDIGYCFDLYASFDGVGVYKPFPDPHSFRVFIKDLADHAATLRAIFTEPHTLDPTQRAIRVTRQVAEHLAELAKMLEAAGHAPELVAKFLMRCLFTMFAEDVGLLPSKLFTNAIKDIWLPNPKTFVPGVQSLWAAMNEGGASLMGKLLRFNGGLFRDPVALPLDTGGLARLLEAAECDWSEVEPAIFGTLLERALNPRERHQLGAHYTPRAYVERLVRPTIEEPLRADWDVVRAEVRQLVEVGKEEQAKKAVRGFHQKLCSLHVLDPACGSGNFLYVTLDLFKRLEGEVLTLLQQLGEAQTMLAMQTVSVTPQQFLGIEKKPWAKEIAELVLWIGYLQWHFKIYGKNLPVPEPVLKDYKNIECRDAVLAYDKEEPVLDENGKQVRRWDGVSVKKSPVTGADVPDEAKTVPLYRYLNARKAEWPKADFVVSNPPFIGNTRMRQALGDGYVDALRQTHEDVPESCELVMYWWNQAANLLRQGQLRRFGLITTNSITQTLNRKVIQHHAAAPDSPLSLTFAIPDHPWVDAENGAAVRIAMTVAEAGEKPGTLATVVSEGEADGESVAVVLTTRFGEIHPDLKIGANVSSARALLANVRLASPGVKLHGAGFIVTQEQAVQLGLGRIQGVEKHIRHYRHGRDVAARSRNVMVIDLDGLSIKDVQDRYPEVHQWVLDRVKPERDLNNEPYRRENWWLFGRRNTELRAFLKGLSRYIATPETAKHRFFVFLDQSILPDNMLVNIGLDDAFFLGVLSSRVHVLWSLAAGGRLGVGNDPRYSKTRCFDPFPFPACGEQARAHVRELAERLDALRKRQQGLHRDLTLTNMYNVLEKVRAGEPLDDKERTVHEQGLISALREIHDHLDGAVLAAYGWPADSSDEQIRERLVALNAERLDEERNGTVRWLRPAFQNPSGKVPGVQQEALVAAESSDEEAAPTSAAPPWPKKLPEQIAAVRDLLLRETSSWTAAQVAARWKGAKAKDVQIVLESLAALGLLVRFDSGEGVRWQAGGRAAA